MTCTEYDVLGRRTVVCGERKAVLRSRYDLDVVDLRFWQRDGAQTSDELDA